MSIERVDSVAAMRARALAARAAGQRIGFVPTMGALHEGHLSLVRRARDESDLVVASIFVNPLQFGAGEDFERYPRDADGDAALLASAGCDVVFTTSAADMYPAGYDTYVIQERTVEALCGASRPGHFRGVLTVVLKLFNIVTPGRAYLGEKDYQQCRVIARMATDLHLPVEVVPCPIVRDADGLALSSRNAYLDAPERARALSLSAALTLAGDAVAAGERSAGAVLELMTARLREGGVDRIDYVELRDADTLAAIETIERPTRALIAVHVGKTRLIDNAALTPPGE